MKLYLQQGPATKDSNDKNVEITVGASLPTDTELSQLIRSYRDKYGTRSKPVGIAPILQLLLTKLQVPLASLDEKSYSSLITCAIHPKEALRILELMDKQEKMWVEL